MTLRRLSQLLALGLFGLTCWAFVSRPGVIGDEFVAEIIGALVFLALLLFGALFLVLRLGTSGAATYWSMDRMDQVRPVGWMIFTTIAIMMAITETVAWLGGLDKPAATAIYLLSVTLVTAAFLLSGKVSWPARRARPALPGLILMSVIGLGVSAGWASLDWSQEVKATTPILGRILTVTPVVVLGATMEEIQFRVLLLTALMDRTGSRFQSVFLSSVAFGLVHVPGVFAEPVVNGDWALLRAVAHEYAVGFPIQILIGLFLGVLWLRTGSITLIALTHALFNLGGDLALGV